MKGCEYGSERHFSSRRLADCDGANLSFFAKLSISVSACGLCFKCFVIVIYNRKLCFNFLHTLQSYFTFQSMAKLARIIILSHWPYSRTVITIVNYDHKTFIVEH